MKDNTKYKVELEEISNNLITELQSLGVQNQRVRQDWIPVPDEPSDTEPDANDLGDRSEEWQAIRGTLDLLETRLNNVKRALQKIEKGTFGTCEICGQQIEEDRLAANPAARTCIKHLAEEDNLQIT